MQLKYKELCELLGEKPKNQTNSKKCQLKRLRQVADIEKIPHKNLYEVSFKSNIQPFKDVLLSNPKDCLAKSLYGLFAQINGYKIMVSLPGLLRDLGVTNKKFYLSKYNSKKVKEICFISECEKIFNRLIKETLNQMKQNDDIYYIKHYSSAVKVFNNKLKKWVCNTKLMTDVEVSKIEIIQTKENLNKILALKIKKSKQGFLKQLDTEQKEKLIKKLLTNKK